jgi:HlyB family type I secretion system ABC transporter
MAPAAARSFLLERSVRRQFAAGSPMAHVSEPCQVLWFIEQGAIDVQIPHPRAAERLPGPILEPGDLYGSHCADEAALHGVWLTALTEVELLEIPAEVLREGLATFPELRRLHKLIWRERAVADLVGQLADLMPREEAALVEFVARMKHETVAKGNALLTAQEQIDDLLIVVAGTAIAEPADADGGRNSHPMRLGPGSAVALASLLLELPAAHDFIAAEELRILRLPGAEMKLLFTAYPALRRALAELVARSLDVRLPTSAAIELDRTPEVASSEGSTAALDGTAEQPAWWQRVPFIRQREEMDCGAACLRVIHAHHGHTLDYRAARTLAKVSRYGTSFMDLREAAERLGYLATGAEVMDWNTLLSLNLPAIAHVDKNHFVVVWRVGRDWVQLSDPAVGKIRQSKAEFLKRFGGYLLILRPTDAVGKLPLEPVAAAAAQPQESRLSAARLWPLVRPFRWLVAHVLFASVLLQGFGLVAPLLTQLIIDRVIGHGEARLLNIIFIALVAMTAGQVLVGLSRSLLMLHISLRLERTVMEAIYRRVVSLAHTFFSKFSTGDLVRRFEEVNAIKNFLSENAVTVLLDLLAVGAYSALLVYLQPRLAVTYLALMLVSGVAVVIFVRPVKRHTRDFLTKFSKVHTHIINSFKGIEPVKAMALESSFGRWFSSLLLPSLTQARRAAQWSIMAGVALQLVDGINTAMLLWRGSGLILAGALTVGQLIAFLMLAHQTTGPFLRLLQQWGEFQRTLVSLERVGDLLEETPEAEQQELRGAGLELPALRGAIRFENVSFRYSNDLKDASRNVIDSLNLTIAPGEVVGIVGRSGCGKSTLSRLLLRFHEPTSGRIALDGFHLRDLNAQALRRQIGLVTQHAFLYDTTIRENIVCGRYEVSEEDLVRAAKAAGAYEFISQLPYGFETKIGEQGLQLSGGQAQRIAIARALCTNPRILIFDEATAALDPLVEREIHEGLREVIRGRTTLIIAHRLHTLRRADRILVFDQGRLVEQGSHEVLMGRQGLYWRMFTASPDWHGAAAAPDASNASVNELREGA